MVYALQPFMRGQIAMPPASKHDVGEQLVPDTSVHSGLRTQAIHVNRFDMNFEHTIELELTTPREIAKTAGMSEAWFTKLQDREMERALEAAGRMDDLRRLLRQLATPMAPGALPIIEVSYDPTGFMTESPFLNDAEAAIARGKREAEIARRLEAEAPARESLANVAKGGAK